MIPSLGEEWQPEDGLRKEGIGQHGDQRPQGEAAPAEQAPAEQKQRDVADEDHQADRPAGVVVDQLRDAADAAAGKLGGDHEQPQRHRLQQGADQDQAVITEFGPVFFVHGMAFSSRLMPASASSMAITAELSRSPKPFCSMAA